MKQAHLIGHDWGGVLGYSAGIHYPSRLKSLVVLSIPLLKYLPEGLLWTPQQTVHSWYILLFQLPLVAELVLKANHFAILDLLYKEWSPGYKVSVQHLEDLKSSFSHPGILASALAYYRNLSDFFSDSGKETLVSWLDAQVRVPSLVLYGEKDGCIHPNLYPRMIKPEDFPRGVTCTGLAGIGHFPHLESPELIAQFSASWMKNYL